MKRFKTTLLLAVLLLIWAALAGGISVYIDSLWYRSVGYWEVFYTEMVSRAIFFLLGFLAAFSLLGLNVRLSSRKSMGSYWISPDLVEFARKGSGYLFWVAALVLSVITGLVVQASWLEFLQFANQVPAEATDPIFGRDISFYFYSLPVYRFVVDFLLGVVVLSVVISGANYLIHGHLGFRDRLQISRSARSHLTLLVAVLLLLVGCRFWLARFSVLYSDQGAVFGAGYADIHAWLPCYWILSVLAFLSAVLVLASLAAQTLRLAAYSGAAFGLGYLALNVYPTLVQTFIVEPNELEKETPYIRYNIASTLRAYKLDEIEIHDFAANRSLTAEVMAKSQGTLRNIRLWDWRPLKDAYGQLQSIRPYYEFPDVDIDRYLIDGEYRQVMLSARELDFSRITTEAQTWINKHFQYTHGYGVCLSPVNEVTQEGLPELFIKDIPPRSTVDLAIERPEVYFGELTEHPVFVGTSLPEFDYPIGDRNAETTYQADRGLSIGSFLMKLLFSWELGSYQILFSDYFTAGSRVLLHRNIRQRVAKIAEFLFYDQDPYLVIDRGRLYWLHDAYTISDRYPYSEPFRGDGVGFNYIRNSVKVVTDAYTGDINFYISDPDDPLIRVYSNIFPGLFKPLSELSEGLRSHLRYPADFFDVQRNVYRRYHMQDPTVFYNQEDLWEIPTEIYRGNEQIMESYYVVMSLPGSGREEFILLTPFTPRNKNNMIGWLAARADGDFYGKLLLYQFTKQELTFGPMQIEARIDQNPEISQLITLWSQKGSEVIRGNLLVVPIEQSLLYVEPLYLQAEKSEIPELTRIIVVFGDRVALGETLEQALSRAVLDREAFPESMLSATDRAAPPEPGAGVLGLEELLRQAQQHFEAGQRHLREGNWAAYGEEQRKLGELLQRLVQASQQ